MHKSLLRLLRAQLGDILSPVALSRAFTFGVWPFCVLIGGEFYAEPRFWTIAEPRKMANFQVGLWLGAAVDIGCYIYGLMVGDTLYAHRSCSSAAESCGLNSYADSIDCYPGPSMSHRWQVLRLDLESR